MARPKPKKWIPKNPEKYAGDVNNIISRSSWETRLFNFLDENPSVIYYNSEDTKIKYFSPVDNKFHNYHPDVLARMRLKDGSEKTFMIEVKPHSQCFPPTTKNKKQFILEMCTYQINQAKWEAARIFCKLKNIEFLILDEYSIGIKQRLK